MPRFCIKLPFLWEFFIHHSGQQGHRAHGFYGILDTHFGGAVADVSQIVFVRNLYVQNVWNNLFYT